MALPGRRASLGLAAVAIVLGAALMVGAVLAPRAAVTGTGAVDAAVVAEVPAVLIAAGDIATCDGGGAATAALIEGMPGTVAALGDNVYEDGTTKEFERCYGPHWGRFLARTRPAVGNHEYHSKDAAPYFKYFGVAAGPSGRGWYSYDLGTWHVIVLNSTCDEIGGCGAGSRQWMWLREDVAAHPARCTLAYWHVPRFSSGEWGSSRDMLDAWRVLYEAGAEVVLSGHDHNYERFAPMDPNGARDDARGIRQFVVGTGGGEMREVDGRSKNSEKVISQTHGVIRLELYSADYVWSFVSTKGEVLDSGRTACH
jgi:hypothetical protein